VGLLDRFTDLVSLADYQGSVVEAQWDWFSSALLAAGAELFLL
jgi:hypothetical protein